MTLFKIADEIRALHDLLTELDGDVSDAQVEETVDQWLAQIGEQVEEKVDAYCVLIHEFEARANARHEESARIAKLGNADTGNAGRLKDRLKQFMEATGRLKIETPAFKLAIQKNGGVLPLIVPEDWEIEPARAPEAFQRRVIQLDKQAIREALRNDEMVNGCALAERGTHLRIR